MSWLGSTAADYLSPLLRLEPEDDAHHRGDVEFAGFDLDLGRRRVGGPLRQA